MSQQALVAGLGTGALVLAAASALRVGGRAFRGASPRRRLALGGWPPRAGGTLVSRLPAPPGWVVDRVARAALAVDPGQAWWAWLAAATGLALAAGLTGGAGLAVVAGVAATVGPTLALLALAGRRDRLVEEALPEALETVARGLRSGASLRQALAEAAAVTPGPLGIDLHDLRRALERGAPIGGALADLERARPLPGVRLAVAALSLGTETGGAQARAVDGVAATIRSRLGVAGEVRALSSQPRLSGMVIALAPVGFAVLATATDEPTAAFLLRTPLGVACLAVGLALDGVAALWMHRLTRV